ncbi:hypothetical protein FocTR4_00011889 [Fusarium oxysporum f. sp. cubense]|uniref:Fumarylacetoacetase-like C-terminal domain-containing protein n=1 Tax=Fusarium oxysporum f. sp. cubense TaxID=61366 RepID=A0A5C6SDE5_FUSOC|nr:hypothetical protein FocTR4_00011889 [Fusarium oxysporum f. sp. cubense]
MADSSKWTHLIRFIAVDDDIVRLGQLVDVTRDVGLDSLENNPIFAYIIEGSIFNGKITDKILQVQQVHVPPVFAKPRTAIANPYPGTINIPTCAQDGTSDYEGELAVVIGKAARDITAQEAPSYILGYTAANDVSARAHQMKSSMPGFSKGMDSSCPLGPVLVSKSAIENPQNLSIKSLYNGDVVQDGNTSDMIFGVYELLAYLSQGTTLEPGSILLTGTPEGIGYFRNPRICLGDGDLIQIQLQGVGTLTNRIHYEQDH